MSFCITTLDCKHGCFCNKVFITDASGVCVCGGDFTGTVGIVIATILSIGLFAILVILYWDEITSVIRSIYNRCIYTRIDSNQDINL
jgi:hypothetical protein